jgi:crotonobetainyl-CoA:carnitine CoA-transferase CaiB-like acyl-CoA transferase
MYNDLVVIELASVLAGPAVGMFFAELGARVIKVENSETMGDVTRSWRLSSEPKESDISSYFSSVNWGKQSIAVNATVPEGRQIVYDLVRNADIVISSYNPGDDKKLALDYDTLSGINSQLIYGHVTGYGKEDPRAGYDAILQAAGEFTYLNGAPEGSPVKMPVALIDLLAAHQLKEALLLALIRRMESGGGGYIHTSLLQSGIASLANQAANWLVAGHIPERSGSDYPNIGPYGGTFKTRDEREVMLSVGNDQQFRKLCAVLGRPELAAIPLYSNNSQRVKNREKLNRLLADQILKFNREELIDKLTENNVPTGGILNMKEVFEQKASEELIIEGSLANGKRITGLRTIAFQSNFMNFKQQLSSPPHLNEHAKKILREDLKYNAEKIKNLKRKGAIMWV